jgi:hypothetical protein
VSDTAPAVDGLFSPQNQALGIDHTGFSPRVQQKIVSAGVECVSYQKASHLLAALSDLAVKPKPVERWSSGSEPNGSISATGPSRRTGGCR